MSQTPTDTLKQELAERMEDFAIELDFDKNTQVLPNTAHAKVIRAVDALHEAVRALRGD